MLTFWLDISARALYRKWNCFDSCRFKKNKRSECSERDDLWECTCDVKVELHKLVRHKVYGNS